MGNFSYHPLVPGITVYSPLRYFGLDKPSPLRYFVLDKPGLKLEVAAMGTLDGIIDTVSAVHPLLHLLKSDGRKLIAGSCIGGIKETQEMIDFAAKHDVKPDIEVIPINYVNTAMERLVKGDVKYRFVINIGNSLKLSS
ncbi:hypothetical protein VNO78_27031 [Psophocarpus tetragonolobus]|uniref:Mannitol dehydrogenase n=1 Tax=Psophocarpus tetragonolobus TaxID=3891 RepID=A0AAN9S0Z8_PSOTE